VQLNDSFRHMTRVLTENQRELSRSAGFQRGLIHNSFDGIIATDATNVVRVFNRVAQNLTGHSEEEVVGQRTWMKLFDPQLARELHRPVFQDGSGVVFGFYRKETAVLAKDGKMVDVLASGVTLREGGRQVGMVFFFKDMREIKKLRLELVHSERLAATGQTVASISHGVKNILDGLRGGAYVYKRGLRIEDPEVRAQGWEMVERNIDHISELVADLLNFAKERVPEREACDPSVLVQDVLFTLQPKADARGTALEMDLDPAANPSQLDAHSMMQLLANLVSNALDATRDVEGGRVRVRTAVTEDDQLEIVVEDNGPGIAPEVRDELFSSLVSTKGSKGTGLGLMVVEKIVSEHDGTVEFLADHPVGAAFRVRIPRQDSESTHTTPASLVKSARVMESK
jgi:PAS domain S-box-containing protein